MAVKLQLECHSGRYTELLDAGNPMVTPDWPYIRWLCRYGENRPGLPRLFNRTTKDRKTIVRTSCNWILDLFDIRNPMVLLCLLYLRWFSRYSQNQ